MKTLMSQIRVQPDEQHTMDDDKQGEADGKRFVLRFMPEHLHPHIRPDTASHNGDLPQYPLADAVFMPLCFPFISPHDRKADDIDDDGI